MTAAGRQYFKITAFQSFRTAEGELASLTLEELITEFVRERPIVNTNHDGSVEGLEEAKKNGAAFSCATFKNNVRGRENVIEASLIALDFDGAKHKALTLAETKSVHDDLAALGFTHLWYDTWSLGMRVVFPLERPASKDEYESLFDRLKTAFRVTPDQKCRNVERLHAAAQHYSEARQAAHRSGFVDTGRLLSSDWSAPAAVTSTGFFSGIRFPKLKLPAAVTVEEYESRVASAVDGEKNTVIHDNAFAVAALHARAGLPEQASLDQLQTAAESGLRQAVVKGASVASWTEATKTVERAVRKAYETVASEQAQALADIPRGQLKIAAKCIADGQLDNAGKVLAKHVRGSLTVDALVEASRDDVENSKHGTSVPDDLNKLRRAIENALPKDWQADLTLDDKGAYAGTELNIKRVLQSHPEVAGRLLRNIRTLAARTYADDMPWGTPAGDVVNVEADQEAFFEWVCNTLHPRASAQTIPAKRAYERLSVAFESAEPFDPLLHALENSQWDGVPRLGRVMQLCDGPVSEYNNTVIRKTLIAVCARAARPGEQVDTVLVLASSRDAVTNNTAQGQRKTSFIRALLPEYFGKLGSLDEREVPQRMSRWAIGLIDEIDRWSSKKASGDLKDFVTETGLERRAAYGRTDKVWPRRAVLFGTSNHEDFVFDETGARRWWSIVIPDGCRLNVERLEEIKDQLWAEAWNAYSSSEKWYFEDPAEERRLCAPPQEALMTASPSASGEKLLELMEYVPPAARYPKGEFVMNPETKLRVLPKQMDGNRMRFITPAQIRDVMKIMANINLDDRQVEQARRSAGLKLGSGRAARYFFRTREEANAWKDLPEDPPANPHRVHLHN